MFKRNICNYDCSVCQKSGKLPNLLGRFYIINESECKCNGCNTVYDKKLFFNNYLTEAINVSLHK